MRMNRYSFGDFANSKKRYRKIGVVVSLLIMVGCSGGQAREDSHLVYDFAAEARSASVLFETPYLDFGNEQYQMVLTSGWSSPEKSGDGKSSWVWAVSRVAKMELLLSESDRQAGEVSFRWRPFVYPGSPTQTLAVHPIRSTEADHGSWMRYCDNWDLSSDWSEENHLTTVTDRTGPHRRKVKTFATTFVTSSLGNSVNSNCS